MTKHGAVELKNRTVSDIISVNVVRVMLVSVNSDPDQQRKGFVQEVHRVHKFVLKN